MLRSRRFWERQASNGDGYKTRSILANARKQTRWISGHKTGESISVSNNLHSKTGPNCSGKFLLRFADLSSIIIYNSWFCAVNWDIVKSKNLWILLFYVANLILELRALLTYIAVIVLHVCGAQRGEEGKNITRKGGAAVLVLLRVYWHFLEYRKNFLRKSK